MMDEIAGIISYMGWEWEGSHSRSCTVLLSSQSKHSLKRMKAQPSLVFLRENLKKASLSS